MAKAQEYIRLDFKDDGRFVSFPEAMLRAVERLLSDAKFEVTVGRADATEVTEKISAKDLPVTSMLRTIVIKKEDVSHDFLKNLSSNGGEVAKNIVVTEFVRTRSLGAGQDIHSSSFKLEDYVSRNSGQEVDLKGAAKTRFQGEKGGFAERFFGSKTGTVATMGAIVAGAGALHFSALNEQRKAAKEQKSTPLAEKIAEIVQEGEQKAVSRVAATSQENQR